MKYEHLHFAEIDSTSSYLKREFDHVCDMTFVSADYQSQGRGRNARQWFSSPGENLLFSLVMKDKECLVRYKDISLACAYVLAKTIEELYPLSPSIKWPNDVYIKGKKMCGILLESHMTEGNIDGLVIGIGVNVNQTKFPDDLIYPVSSLAVELGHSIDMDSFRDKFFDNLTSYLPSLKEDKKDHLRYAQSHDYLKEQKVKAHIHELPQEVTVIGIQDDCSLRVSIDGKERNLISGEITFH